MLLNNPEDQTWVKQQKNLNLCPRWSLLIHSWTFHRKRIQSRPREIHFAHMDGFSPRILLFPLSSFLDLQETTIPLLRLFNWFVFKELYLLKWNLPKSIAVLSSGITNYIGRELTVFSQVTRGRKQPIVVLKI